MPRASRIGGYKSDVGLGQSDLNLMSDFSDLDLEGIYLDDWADEGIEGIFDPSDFLTPDDDPLLVEAERQQELPLFEDAGGLVSITAAKLRHLKRVAALYQRRMKKYANAPPKENERSRRYRISRIYKSMRSHKAAQARLGEFKQAHGL